MVVEYSYVSSRDKTEILCQRLLLLEREHYSLSVERELFVAQAPSTDNNKAIAGLSSQISSLEVARDHLDGLLLVLRDEMSSLAALSKD